MNTAMISAALPSNTPSGRNQSDQADSGFSSVLNRQHAIHTQTHEKTPAGKDAARPSSAQSGADDAALPGQSPAGRRANTAAKNNADAASDADAAPDGAVTGANLPQIALNIAAEAAAVQQSPNAHGSAPGRAAGADRGPSGLPAQGAALDALENAAIHGRAEADSGRLKSPGQAAAESDALVGAMAGLKASAPTGRDDAQARLPSPRFSAAPGKAASLAGARQAVLAMQARMQAAEQGQARLVSMPDFIIAGTSRAASETPSGLVAEAGLLPTAAEANASSGAAASAQLSPALSPMLQGPASLAAPSAPLAMASPLQSSQWGMEFGRQFLSIVQSADGKTPHTAELRLDPPELGPLRISINIQDSVANAAFVSPHAAVRQAVENALPQLQQLLAQSGLSLGQASVSDHGQAGQAFGDPSSGSGDRRGNEGGPDYAGGIAGAAAPAPRARTAAPNALVDTFA